MSDKIRRDRIGQRRLRNAGTALAICATLSATALSAQTASQITPESFQPELRRLNGSVEFTGQTGTQAPPGADAIGITLSGVDLKDGLPQLAQANAAYRARLTRGRIPVSELFEATADLEAAYANEGFILSRVVLPQQSLRDGGRLQVVVVKGFIEDVDTSNVSDNTRARIEALTERLLNDPELTQAELERQLLLAGDVPGTALRSALGAGAKPGAAVIALDPEYRPVTGFLGFGNPSSSQLGTVNLNLGIELNSTLKFGETLYGRLSGAPNDFFSSTPQSRIIALGAVVPLGVSGLTLNVEATKSDTTPDNPAAPTRSKFERQSVRLAYPFIRSRQTNLSGQVVLDRQEDTQQFLGGAAPVTVFRDKITVLRFGGNLTYIHDDESVTDAGFILSRGINALGATTAAEAAAAGSALSRQNSDATFTKIAGSFSHRRALSNTFALSVTGRAQSSFGDALVTAEQFSIVGAQELSPFDAGSLRGDAGWVVRAEMSTVRQTRIGQIPVLLSPYAFLGAGSVSLESPTATEQRRINAYAYGVGMDIFTQTDSNFRSTSVRLELGRGERDDTQPDESRFSITGNMRF
ncbi:MAG: ShlB/FhaC/HecB family hemolysin secretion/activation protein [Pseudomonadota bacterium]